MAHGTRFRVQGMQPHISIFDAMNALLNLPVSALRLAALIRS